MTEEEELLSYAFTWDDVLTDEQLRDKIKELADSTNPTVKYNAIKWIAEGKGHKTGLVDMNVESIEFMGLDENDGDDKDE